MSARSRMTHRAVVERSTPAASNDWGQPGADVWAVHLTALPAWYWQTTERELVGPDKNAIVGEMRMLVPRDTDIRESDRINGVTTKAGETIRSGVLLIEAVIGRRDHIELVLRGVGS